MGLRYYKLFDTLQRRGMKKGELMEKAKLSWPTLSKLSKGQAINSEIIDRICFALECQPGDIMEHIPDQQEELSQAIEIQKPKEAVPLKATTPAEAKTSKQNSKKPKNKSTENQEIKPESHKQEGIRKTTPPSAVEMATKMFSKRS